MPMHACMLVSAHDLIYLPLRRKDYSAAIWRPALGAAEVVKSRKGTAQNNGAMADRSTFTIGAQAPRRVGGAPLCDVAVSNCGHWQDCVM